MAKLLSRLPWWALYALSRFIYVLAYYVARHRHKVIRDQLARVFPQMSESERTAIHKRFLKNFCDVLVETLKSLSMKPVQMIERVRFADPSPVRNSVRGRPIGDAGDLASVQLGVAPAGRGSASRLPGGRRLQAAARCVGRAPDAPGAYPFRREAHSRERAARRFSAPPRRRARAGDELRPGARVDRQAHWTSFLGQDTAFYVGAEQIARATRLPIVYMLMRRVKRGYYKIEARELWDGREIVPPNGDHRALRAGVRGGCARPPGGLALVLSPLEVEKAAVRENE